MSLSNLKQTFIKNKEDFLWGRARALNGECNTRDVGILHIGYGLGIFLINLIIYFITNEVLRFNIFILTIKKVLIVFVICSIYMFFVMFYKLYRDNKSDCITGNQLKMLMFGYIIMVLLIFLMYKTMFGDINLKLKLK
jgi:hypothetical protein